MPLNHTDIHVFVLQEQRTLYRACFGSARRDLLHAVSSNYEIDRQPPHPADLRATALHMAVSGFEDAQSLTRLASRRPDRIGTHIATLQLEPGKGVCLADTGGAGHWSIRGIPAQPADFVVDVVGV